MDIFAKQQLISYLFDFVTKGKREKMMQVLANRTRQVTIIMEDIFQSHNANAVMRSAECFGIQDVHIVENRFKFSVSSGVAMGATKWLTLHKYPTIEQSFAAVRAQGYRIIATTPAPGACQLPALPLDTKFALVFGTENTGLTEYALNNADAFVKIPMYGFTQSFNVSVSVALCLQYIITTLRSTDSAWHLSEEERLEILLAWLRSSVRAADLLEKRFLSQI